MLLELNITNFAIIERLSLRLNPGFNALTGETGAGKSIIIDAMGAMLGEKVGAEFVRFGAERARIEGYFELSFSPTDERFKPLLEILDTNELLEEDERPNLEAATARLPLTLTREIATNGRTVCRVNGSAVKLDVLREIGQALVDIHGQTEHMSLLRVSEHLELLDEYATVASKRRKLGEMVGTLRTLRKERQTLQQDERELARRVELLKFQTTEIEAASLKPGEEEGLLQERQLQNSAEKISGISDTAYRHLYQGFEEDGASSYAGIGRSGGRNGRGAGGAGNSRAIIETLSEVEGLLEELSRYSPEFKAQIEAVQEARYKLEDVSHAVRDFRESIEHDPARLEDIEDRLDLIRSLKRKYGANIAEMLEFYSKAAKELNSIEHSGERLEQLAKEEEKLLTEVGKLAGEISAERQVAALKLASEVEQALKDLRLMRTTFVVQITQQEERDGVPVPATEGSPNNETRRLAFDGKGVDRVEFLISLNPGEPPKPLQKVASGGETSRLMLALKSILASADAVPTLIFDEVDVGVGGRSGQVVGEKLWSLTKAGEHQVICITHLPQIAAFGDAHYNIVKRVEQERTTTIVRQLTPPERVEELAAMLGTPVTETLRLGASEMLRETEGWKTQARQSTTPVPF